MNDASTVSGLVGRIALDDSTPVRASESRTCDQKTPGWLSPSSRVSQDAGEVWF
jgi:hypothetical protein